MTQFWTRQLDSVREVLTQASPDGDAWLVGGVVRDAAVGRAITDVDVAVDCDPREVARALAAVTGGDPFELSDEHGCWRVVGGQRSSALPGPEQWDICRIHGGSIAEDLARRDFTINAMAVSVHDGELLDPTGGLTDLRQLTLRMVSSQALDDDPLRMLRAARIAHAFGLRVDDDTASAIRVRSERAGDPAGERIFQELRLLLGADRPRRAIRTLDALGLLPAIIPELEATKGIAQTRFHHLDTFEHTLAVLDNVSDIADHLPHYFPGTQVGSLTSERQLVLRLAAVLHDVGKPATMRVHRHGAPSFMGHDEVGAAMADEACRRWVTSTRMRRAVVRLVQTHLELGRLLGDDIDRRVVWRFLQVVDGCEREAVCLSLADRHATMGVPNKRRWLRRHEAAARRIWAEIDRYDAAGVPTPLLDGAEISKVAKVAPGPRLGVLVGLLAEAQAVGEVATVAEAREFIRSVGHTLDEASPVADHGDDAKYDREQAEQ